VLAEIQRIIAQVVAQVESERDEGEAECVS
jgi:hypothetical protein